MILRMNVTVATLLAATTWQASAQQRNIQYDLVNNIVKAWRAKQAQVKTITCSAKVDSFYSKGCLSEVNIYITGKKGGPIFPPQDTRFTGEPCSWAIDFDKARIRQESNVTVPFGSADGKWVFVPNGTLKLFANGKFRSFRPRDRDPWKGGTPQDGTLYERASHDFVLSAHDLALLWVAGAVSGKWANPHRLRHLDSPKRFTYRGRANWKGRACVILTVPEQKSATTSREFWVGAQKPFPIYLCRVRNGNRTTRKIEISYRKQEGAIVPAKWTHAVYNKLGSGFKSTTYFIEEFNFNQDLDQALFEKHLTPGMILQHVEKRQFLEVDLFGNLVPLGTANVSSKWVFIVVGAIIVALLVFCFWRIARKRLKASSK